MRLRTLLLPILALPPALALAQALASDTDAAAEPLGDGLGGAPVYDEPGLLPEKPTAVDDASPTGAVKTPVLSCVPSAKVMCCKPGTSNCDPWGWLYYPESCDGESDCECPGLGVARCGVCPDDEGSDFIKNKVCYCQGLPGSESGSQYECHPGKPNGPKRIQKDVVPAPEPAEKPRKKRSASKNSKTPGSKFPAVVIGGTAACVAVIALVGGCMYFRLFGMSKKKEEDEKSENIDGSSEEDLAGESFRESNPSAEAVVSGQVSGVTWDADVENGLEKMFSGFAGGARGSRYNGMFEEGDVDVVGAAPPLPEGPPPADWKRGNGNEWESYFDEATGGNSQITPPHTYGSSGYEPPLPPGTPPPAGSMESKYRSGAARNRGTGAFWEDL